MNRAHKFAKANLKEDDADLGGLLIALGQTYDKMGKPDDARNYYSKGTKTLQLVCDHAADPSQRVSCQSRLKKALEYYAGAAEAAGASAEAETLKKRIAALP